MRRRDLVGLLGAAVLLRSRIASAQQPAKVYRLGFVVQFPRRFLNEFPGSAMLDELRLHGFIEGQNLAIDPRGFATPADRLDAVAAAIAAGRPDVIYAGGNAADQAVQRATAKIPVVVTADDAIRAHLVASLSHPGGNITGISILATELDGKRLSLLIELVPGIAQMAALADPKTTAPDQVQELVAAARSRNVTLTVYEAGTAEQIVPAIEAARAGGAQALDVLASALFNANRTTIIARANAARLPAMQQWLEYAQQGALICYGPSFESFFRQAGRLLVKVLDGERPADIPVEQPTHIELAINLKSAKALGLTVPQLLLAQADEIIQ
jgi:putative tryptophan/tyrosine transport system substrate-binding protein